MSSPGGGNFSDIYHGGLVPHPHWRARVVDACA